MSGGSMGYRHEQIRMVLEDHRTLFKLTGADGKLCVFRAQFQEFLSVLHEQMRAAADMLQAVELEDSGDASEKATQQAWLKFCNVYHELKDQL